MIPKASRQVKPSLPEHLKCVHSVLSQPLKVFLDLKSRWVPHRIWALLIDTMSRYGNLEVVGVGSFMIADVRGIAGLCKRATVTENIYLHSAGDLQYAIHDGSVKRGDRV
jgi:hypothetical protein